MKIMSLNVNRFSGMKDRDFTNSIENLDECPKANEIITFVKRFLSENPDDVVFLYEVPYWRGSGWGKNFKWVEKRGLYEKFRKQFPEGQFELSEPGREGDSCTLAIWKKKWETRSDFKMTEEKKPPYANKYVELIRKDPEFRLIGLHAPGEYQFLSSLQEYAATKENFILIGDFNIATNEWRTEKIKKDVEEGRKSKAYLDDFLARQKWLIEIMPAIGYHDAIKGDPITYFKAETTADHVLVSPALQGKVTAEVIPQKELELSDHAVIIVDVNL